MMTKNFSAKIVLPRQLAMIFILALSAFLFGNRIEAQDTTIKGVPSGKEMPSTKEGVSKELLDEYDSLVRKHIKDTTRGYPINGGPNTVMQRMETIFKSMSREQQSQQIVHFAPMPPPFEKRVPSVTQIETWKNAKMYGVWIDGKRIQNAELNKYSNADFDHVFISKLSKNAINYGKHYYQVDLMTKSYYADYYAKAIKDRDKRWIIIRYRLPEKK